MARRGTNCPKPRDVMEEFLFELPPQDLTRAERKFRQLDHPIWTESKANLIERYLCYFVYITKHGTYIDAFAGPQRTDRHEMWAAKLVIESRPRWFRNFHLFEIDKAKVETLRRMCGEQSPPDRKRGEPNRFFNIVPGDFNKNIHDELAKYPIKETEAAFCLLDQRTFECDWASVEVIARHKRAGNKVELFYFLPNAWLDRSAAALGEQDEAMRKWWGDSDWKELLKLRGMERAQYACTRFKRQLGYRYVYPFPIYERKDGGKKMFFMIHASDHEQATPLMYRAYGRALGVKENAEQLQLLAVSVQNQSVQN